MIAITVMIKDGGYQVVMATPEMIGKIAESIRKQGFEYIALSSGVIVIVGFMVTGKQTGERVIMLGKVGQEVSP